MSDLDQIRDDDGKLPSYAWPGGYQVLYLCQDGETLCPDCANDVGEFDSPVEAHFTNWEGPATYCAECNAEFESEWAHTVDLVPLAQG